MALGGVKRFPDQPAHPERLCWGCARYGARNDMLCGNGSVRTPHPVALFGADWGEDTRPPVTSQGEPAARSPALAHG